MHPVIFMQRFQINLCVHELLVTILSLSLSLSPTLSPPAPISPLSPDQDQASPLNIDSIEVSGADSSDEENNTSSDSDEERYNESFLFCILWNTTYKIGCTSIAYSLIHIVW